MKIVNAKPPIWEEANKVFRLEELRIGTIFTYGDTIFNTYAQELTEDLIVHEMVHGNQQMHNNIVAKLWWRQYLEDAEFRKSQEAEAYGAQYRFLAKHIKDRNQRARKLDEIAHYFAGPMYGNIVTHFDAMALIRKHARI